jgi:hypothetical protein
MIVEKFFNAILKSKIIDIYVAIAFIATAVFFIMNISLYTPFEILVGIVLVTLSFKGLAYLMVSFVIMFFDLKQKEDSVQLQQKLAKLDSLVDELALQQTKLKNNKITNHKE